MAGACGTCTACCRVFSIPKLNKPAGKWCDHCAIGVGCTIYNQRPDTCVHFTCMWLESYTHGFNWPEEQRPDRCKVVFSPTTKPGIIAGTTMPGSPDAWKRGAAKEIIETLVHSGIRVVVGAPNSLTKIMIDEYGQSTVEMTEPDKNGIQWNKKVC